MSNRTPTKPDDETASEPNSKNPVRLILGLVLVVFGVLAVVSGIIGLSDNRSRLYAPNGTITIETVDSPQERQKGLSGRESIGDDEGMMFVFDEVSKDNCFWMKDMNFPIDMIWLDENKKVITVYEFVGPQTYPESFCPESPAKYGLEVQGNKSFDLGIVKDSTVRF